MLIGRRGSLRSGLQDNVSHFFTSAQGCTGCGAFHLNSPTGGAAKECFKKHIYRHPYYQTLPETRPVFVFTTGFFACAINIIGSKQ
jgi:hypothetical protein